MAELNSKSEASKNSRRASLAMSLAAFSLFLTTLPSDAQGLKSLRDRARNKISYLLNPQATQAKPVPNIPSIQTVPAADATAKTTPEASEKAIRESERQAKYGLTPDTTAGASSEPEKKASSPARSWRRRSESGSKPKESAKTSTGEIEYLEIPDPPKSKETALEKEALTPRSLLSPKKPAKEASAATEQHMKEAPVKKPEHSTETALSNHLPSKAATTPKPPAKAPAKTASVSPARAMFGAFFNVKQKQVAPAAKQTQDPASADKEENDLKALEDDSQQEQGDQSGEESISKLTPEASQQTDEHMKSGDRFFAKHDYTNAMIEYGRVVQLDDGNIKARYMLGKVLLAMSDYQEALKEFDKIIEMRPRHSDAYFMRGEAFRLMGKHEDAFTAYKRSIRLNKRNALAHTYLGECYRTRTWYRPALFECHKAVQIDPKLVAPHLILSECYKALGQKTDALEELSKALELDPKDATAHIRFARTLGEMSRWDESIIEFTRASTLDPHNAKAHEGHAWALASTKKLNEALTEARKAVALAPNDADVHSTMAWIYQKKGEHQSAVTQYKLALRLSPGNQDLHKSLGLALADAGDLNGAVAELMTATQLEPSDYDAKLQLQALLQKRGK